MQISTRVQLILAAISVLAVLVFFVKVIIDLGADNNLVTTFNPNSSPDGWSGIFFGVLYGVLIFVGFETAANLAEETVEPQRHIPRAVLFSIVVVSLFYLIATYATVAGFGFSLDRIFAANESGPVLFGLSDPSLFGSALIAKIIVVVVFFDILAVGVGVGVTSARGVFAMARDRRLPAPAAKVSRHGSPVGAIVTIMVFQAAWVVTSEASDTFLQLGPLPHYFSIFIWNATFGGFALLVVYLLMSLGAIRGLAEDPARVRLAIAVVLGVLITGIGIFGSFYKVTSPLLIAPWAVVVWGALGLGYMLVVKGREPASQVLSDLRAEANGKGA